MNKWSTRDGRLLTWSRIPECRVMMGKNHHSTTRAGLFRSRFAPTRRNKPYLRPGSALSLAVSQSSGHLHVGVCH